MKTNKTIETILNHRSIRRWKDQPVDQEILDQLYEVANRTSTSTGMQYGSIVRVTDKEKRKEIARVTTQAYVEEAPEFWIFIADAYRNKAILKEAGKEDNYAADVDRFFAGVSDAILMVQNVGNAVESLGMGFTIFGSIQNDLNKIIEVLELPKYTFPILGLGFGYPDQDPALKPRMDVEHRIFENTYEKFDNYRDLFEEYDQVLSTYYDLRNDKRPVDTFTKQAVDKFTSQNPKRQEMIKVARQQGFDLD